MRWHRIIYWICFSIFSIFTIAAEGGRINMNSIIKLVLFTALTAGAVNIIDCLSKAYFHKGKYFLASLVAISIGVVSIAMEAYLQEMIVGPFGLPIENKLLENLLLMGSWIVIAVCIFIAEDFGRLKITKLNAELLYLKYQVNPHFLLNTHNNLYFLIRQNPILAETTLLKLSDIMKYMLYECSAEMVSLEKEFTNLMNYVELEKIRKNENLSIEYELKTPTKPYCIAPLLLIPFVENAFKHISNHKDKENFIKVNGEVMDGRLTFRVENTFSTNVVKGASGIGLSNVKQRLELIYKKRYFLKIDKEASMFSIDLSINLK